MIRLLITYAVFSVVAVMIESLQSYDVSEKVKRFNQHETYSCGDVNEAPIEVLHLQNGNIGKINQNRQHYILKNKVDDTKNIPSCHNYDANIAMLQNSAPDTVCVLLRITKAPNSNSTLDHFSRSSQFQDYRIVPVARSYAGFDWERVEGPYAQSLNSTCHENTCILDIPALANLEYGKFYLMSFAHSLPDKAVVSRFFQQTTFGPTLEMINSWDYSVANIQSTMASWIKSQMMSSPTFHREYFRSRMDGPRRQVGDETSKNVGPFHPCGKGASWTRMAFREEDNSSIQSTVRSDGSVLLSVGGVPRTVVQSWQYYWTGEYPGSGTFYMQCKNLQFKLNGLLRIRKNDICQRVKGGNPPIYLPPNIGVGQVTRIDIPDLVGPTANTFVVGSLNNLGGEVYYLPTDFSSDQCNSLDLSDYDNLIGTTPDGTQYIYNGYVKLKENSLESPFVGGDTDFIETSVGNERCSNPVMSFTNGKKNKYDLTYSY